MTDGGTRRLSTEAWAAIGVIVAALITGVVTLLVHILPTGGAPSPTAPGAAQTTIAAGSAATGAGSAATTGAGDATTTIRAIVGRWQGTARDENGATFQITLEVTKGCAVGQPCGSISVSHVPCYGRISLKTVDNGDVEFNVDSFDKRSNPNVCQPGAGEHFRLQSGGTLAYHTTYQPVAQGTLHRV